MILCFDIEADNHLEEATKIHCLVADEIIENGARFLITSPKDSKSIEAMINQASIVIGHNIIGYDLPLLEKLFGIPYTIGPDTWNNRPVTFIDTLVWSRYLYPDREGGHSLESWGKRLGFHKLEHDNFKEFSEEMLEYCKQDVRLTTKLYKFLKEKELEA